LVHFKYDTLFIQSYEQALWTYFYEKRIIFGQILHAMLKNLGINIRQQYEIAVLQDVLLSRFNRIAESQQSGLIIHTGNDKVFVKLKESSWYSPELTLTIEAKEGGVIIREIVGPNPATFTMTIFLLTGGLMVFFLAIMIALSQLSLGMSTLWSFIVASSAGLFSVIVYFFIWSGRYRAGGQIQRLKTFVQGVMGS
jgi:hypothetical protein